MFPSWTKLEAAAAARKTAGAAVRKAALAAGKGEATADREASAAADNTDVAKAIEKASLEAQTPEQTAIEMMAHGGGVIEVIKDDGQWRVVPDSRYARRITAATEMAIAGPAAGHELLKTSADPTGTRVLGMLNNCAGGKTPWGTWLSAEENFHGYFGGSGPETGPLAATYQRYGVPGGWYAWGRSIGSTSPRNRTSRTASAGWSRSTPTTRARPRSSAPRSAA
jgi:secreted PhoX family phosphatase